MIMALVQGCTNRNATTASQGSASQARMISPAARARRTGRERGVDVMGAPWRGMAQYKGLAGPRLVAVTRRPHLPSDHQEATVTDSTVDNFVSEDVLHRF